MNSRTRLFKELKEAQRDGNDGDVELCPDDTNIYRWTAWLKVTHVGERRESTTESTSFLLKFHFLRTFT